tara:strand:- start:3581 stop:4492 length:912 start_codon:yes stop_codon:yes gene_type:complete
MDKQIFWLSSYPKSGNTLLRSILIGLFFTKEGKFSLEMAKNIGQFDITIHAENNKHLFQEDYKKIGDIRVLYKYLNKLQSKKALGFNQDFIFLKTHSGLFEINKSPFTSKQNTRGIIYVVRDPRDVCISYSKHSGISINKCIKFMTNDTSTGYWMESRKKDKIFSDINRPKSLLGSWEKHVLSWTSIDWGIPSLILRFEDLVYEKEKTINKIINFFEKNYNFKFHDKEKRINNVLLSTSFNKLKMEEEEKGFAEATKYNKFFSVGQKDQWKKKLNKEQLIKIEEKFGEVMIKFKYNISSLNKD